MHDLWWISMRVSSLSASTDLEFPTIRQNVFHTPGVEGLHSHCMWKLGGPVGVDVALASLLFERYFTMPWNIFVCSLPRSQLGQHPLFQSSRSLSQSLNCWRTPAPVLFGPFGLLLTGTLAGTSRLSRTWRTFLHSFGVMATGVF